MRLDQVEHNVVWTRALLKRANISKFLKMLNWSHLTSWCFLREHVPSCLEEAFCYSSKEMREEASLRGQLNLWFSKRFLTSLPSFPPTWKNLALLSLSLLLMRNLKVLVLTSSTHGKSQPPILAPPINQKGFVPSSASP